MFLAFPRMTADLLVLGIAGNCYNWIGTELYDLRLKRLLGRPYLEYVHRTGLIFPSVFRNFRGAYDLELPKPTHWRHPLNNVPGIAIGILGGVIYWALLGRAAFTATDLWLSWGASFVVAVLGGALYAAVNASQLFEASHEDFDRFQTRVSTNTALVSTTSIVCWFTISAVWVGQPPTLGVILPMWLVVLWIGHGFAVATLALSHKLAPIGETAGGSPRSTPGGARRQTGLSAHSGSKPTLTR